MQRLSKICKLPWNLVPKVLDLFEQNICSFDYKERILEMRRLILADTEEETREALNRLLEFQEKDLTMFQATKINRWLTAYWDPIDAWIPTKDFEIGNFITNLKNLLKNWSIVSKA